MVALIANILNWLSAAFLRQVTCETLTHHLNIPLPPIIHKVLDAEFVAKFDQVLIVGDVHGCFDELMELLNNARQQLSSESRILKLFVGDLVNKGPKNREVIQYLLNQGREDSLSVRGNHDEFVIKRFLEARDHPEQAIDPKNSWIQNLTEEEVDYLISLPYTISLPSLNSIIVHAGLIPGKPLEQNALYDMVNMRNLLYGDYFEDGGIRATKSDQEGEPWAPNWKGPQFIYFGHDARRQLQKNEFCLGLDTGCVYGGQLTGILIKHGLAKLIQVPAKAAYQPVNPRNEL